MSLSILDKKHVLKLRIVSACLSLAPTTGVIFTYLESGGFIFTGPYVVPIELAHGFYTYIIATVLIWISTIVSLIEGSE